MAKDRKRADIELQEWGVSGLRRPKGPNTKAKKTKIKDVNLNLSKQTEELYGIFEGINAPDKKDIRKAMYESNN